ncbi:MAG TPA: family 10 glycosylhydrolase [Flavobacterium sp.]|nr:family 10 glycosylhydrolase [Flavobacterium sp.]
MKKTKIKFSKFLFLGLLLLVVTIVRSQCVTGTEFSKTTPKRDLRGVFVASVFNLDWPTNKTATPAVQQAELLVILDNLKTNGYNTVFLQVRSEGDAIYPSIIEPWTQWLTGTQGLAPNPIWDPLAFAVTEAHNRGLELHAWLNPYRVQTSSAATYPRAANHVINENPSWVFTATRTDNATNNIKIMDPGLPQVRDHIVQVVQEIASNYNVDGIHFDDYFYLAPASSTAYGMLPSPNNQDATTYAAYNPGGLTLADWRRDNVNKMIANVYDAIQTINTSNNKNIIFGVSPFGIWKSGTPAGISGQSSYNDLFCDPIAWLNAGKVDYIAPQLYWKITGSQDYISLSKWWNDQAKLYNKQLFISQGIYRLRTTANGGADWPITEIQNQIIQNRAATMDATFGQIFYQYKDIKNNEKTVNTTLNATEFKYKSFAPPIAGKDAICPNSPQNIRFVGTKLTWDTPAAATDGDLPEKYVVYAFANAAEAITNKNDGSKILDIVVGNELEVAQALIDTKHFVVTSLDKNNNEAGDFNTTLGNPVYDLLSNHSFKVYPNPFEDQFEIEFYNSVPNRVSASIFDSTGKQIWQNDFGDSNAKITIAPTQLSKGIYFVKISFENGASESFKVIKK